MSLIEKAARRLEEMKRVGGLAQAGAVARPKGGDSPFRDARRFDGGPARTADPTSDRAAVSPFIEPGPARRSKEVQVDLQRLAAAGMLTPDRPRSVLADEFRVIKRPLLANARGKAASPIRRGNLIMIASSLPGEGKTFTSINLAMSIAMELDSTVLLVDADVSRAAVLDRLGLPPAPGLLDVLTQGLDLSDVLLKLNIDRLTLMPAGTPHPRATELLASEGMSRLLDELASRYSDRIVLFDAPPLLVSTESSALATQVGQVVLVVEADRTSQSAVKQSLAMLENCPVVMSVLNKTQQSGHGEYYGRYGLYGE